MGRRDALPESFNPNTQALSYFKVGTVFPGLPDRRDYTRVAKTAQVAALPDEWEESEDEEENQGSIGSCGAFTTVQALEHEYKRQGRDVEFSPRFQYLLTLKEQNVVCQDFGSFMRTAFSVPITYGALLESQFPYGSHDLCTMPDSEQMQAATAFRPEPETGQYIKAGASLQDMMALAYGTNGADGHPPCVAFLVYSNFQPNERGETPMPAGTRQGGHVTRLCGWSRRRNRVKVKNWWTRGWGVNGYGWLPMELFGLDPNQGGIWLDDAYALDITVSPTPGPAPEPEDEVGFSEGYARCREDVLAFMQDSIDFYQMYQPRSEFIEGAQALVSWEHEQVQNFLPPPSSPKFSRPTGRGMVGLERFKAPAFDPRTGRPIQ